MLPRVLLVIVCLGGVGVRSRAAEPQAFAPVDPETVAAYERAGATFGGFDTSDGGITFVAGPKGAAGRLPACRFESLPAGGVRHLPPVRVPFGLDLLGTNVTGADLGDLGAVENLAALNLSHTSVTDEGLTGLKGFRDLTALDLSYTEVTDEGVAALKGLKRLTSLRLVRCRVTAEGVEQLCRALPHLKIDHKPNERPKQNESWATDIKPGAALPQPAISVEWTDGGIKIGPRSRAETDSQAFVPGAVPAPGQEPPFDDSRRPGYFFCLALVALLGRSIGRSVANRPRLRDRTTVGVLLAGATTGALVVGFSFLILRWYAGIELPVSSNELLCDAVAVTSGVGSYLWYRSRPE